MMEMSSMGSDSKGYGSFQKMKQLDLLCRSDNEDISYQKLKGEQVLGIRMEDSACRVEISGRSEKAFCLNVEGLGFSVAALKHSMECSVELTGHKLGPQKRGRELVLQSQEKAASSAEIEVQHNEVLCKINNFEAKEISRFIQSFKRFPRPITRLEAIARDANLEGKSFHDLKQLGIRLQNGCHECVKEFQTKVNENNGDDVMKTVIPTFQLSGVIVKALSVLEKEALLEPLVLSLPSDPHERKNYHISAPCRAVENWHVPWTEDDDSRFLQGIYEYGMGRWQKIKMDPNLNLTDKLLLSYKKKKPQAIDLWARANYLLQVLQMQLAGKTEDIEEPKRKTNEKKRQAEEQLMGEREEKEEPKSKKNKKREKLIPTVRLTRSNIPSSNGPDSFPSIPSGSTAKLSEQNSTTASERRPDTNLETEDMFLQKVLDRQQQTVDIMIEPIVRLTRSNILSPNVSESTLCTAPENVDSTAELSEQSSSADSERRPDATLEAENMVFKKILNQQQQILDPIEPNVRITGSNVQSCNVLESISSNLSENVPDTAELSEQNNATVSEKRPNNSLETENMFVPKVTNQQHQILDSMIEPTVRLTRSNVHSSNIPEPIPSTLTGNVDATTEMSEHIPATASEKRPNTSLEMEDLFLQKILNRQQQILDTMIEVQDLVKNYRLAKLKIQSGSKPREVLAEFQLTF